MKLHLWSFAKTVKLEQSSEAKLLLPVYEVCLRLGEAVPAKGEEAAAAAAAAAATAATAAQDEHLICAH